eukprot:Gb_27719 [translate_table: standard]
MVPILLDGTSIGEIVMRGNMVMKGYLMNPLANQECFRNGWFHIEDLAVKHPNGTTSDPKGVVLSYRGVYLESLSAALMWDMKNGAVTTKDIFSSISQHKITHFCTAPLVLNTIVHAKSEERTPIEPSIHVMTAGATPPASVLASMSKDESHDDREEESQLP